MERMREQAYFAASNSGRGFVSFFDEIFYDRQIVRRYVIKGGPGTGKSSFLRRVAKRAEMKGRDVRYYYCSSDTDSLDGVIIDSRVALLDGTAPHSCDTALVGACDEIINLGEFWDSSILVSNKDDIGEYTFCKKREYADAYSYLSAAEKTAEACRSLTLRFTDKAKLIRAAEKLCGDGGSGQGRLIRAQISAFGVKGDARLPTLRRTANQTRAIEDYYGAGALFMTELLRAAARRGCRAAVSYDAVLQTVPDEILFIDSGELFYLCKSAEDGERTIKCTRFVDKNALAEIRSAFRVSAQTYHTLLSLASERLAAAGRYHARLERIYGSAMNFDAVQKKCNDVIQDTERYY